MKSIDFAGKESSDKKYVVVLSIDSGKGPVAKINVETRTSTISYSRPRASNLVEIRNGKVNLKRALSPTIAATLNNTKITITTSGRSSTIVIIVILPLYFGDDFIDLVQMKSNSKSKTSLYSLKPITPLALLHFIRRPNEKARKITMAQQNLESKIMKIKKIIFKRLGKAFK